MIYFGYFFYFYFFATPIKMKKFGQQTFSETSNYRGQFFVRLQAVIANNRFLFHVFSVTSKSNYAF